MKSLLLLVLSTLLVGCGLDKKIASPVLVVDQCLRREAAEACLRLVPKGPEHTKYNDWDEVVDACYKQAYYIALRKEEFIQPQCAL